MYNSEAEKLQFHAKLAQAVKNDDLGKVAADISPYIKLRVYEQSFTNALLRPRIVAPGELIPEPDANDTFFIYGQIDQPTQRSVSINFRGQTPTWLPGGRRFKIPIGRHTTQTTRKPEDELLAFDYDLFQDLNEKDVYGLHTLRDRKFLDTASAAAITTGRVSEYPLSGALTVVRPEKVHFTTAAQLLESGSRTGDPSEDTLKATKHLMGSQIWHDLNLWDANEAGSEHVSQVTINGYPATKIMGINYITSTKNHLFVIKDAVMILTMTDLGVNTETLTIDGTQFTWKTDATDADTSIALGSDAATAATAVYTSLSAVLGDNYIVTNPSAGVVRVRKQYDADWSRFGTEMTVASASDITNGSYVTGFDRWDHLFTFPDEEYLGELVRITGMEISSEIWKERSDKLNEICRRSTELSGGAIGNINGVALTRLQRSKFTG